MFKNSITYIFSHYIAKIDSYDSYGSLPIEKKMTLHNVIITKSVLNKDKNHYYYKIFLEKCSNQVAKKYSQEFFSKYNNVELWRNKSNKRNVLCCKKTYKDLGEC